MNWKKEIQKVAFLNELNKLAAGIKPGPIKKAVTGKIATITKLAEAEDEDDEEITPSKGRIYRSKDEVPAVQNRNVTRSPYESFSEDSAFGYKIATFKPPPIHKGFPMPRLNAKSTVSPIHKSLSTIGYRGTTERGSNKLTKIGELKGKRYPSKEMKKEYDAANDSETIDLDSTTVFSPSYATNHMAIKV